MPRKPERFSGLFIVRGMAGRRHTRGEGKRLRRMGAGSQFQNWSSQRVIRLKPGMFTE
jgi:hypothetical protein